MISFGEVEIDINNVFPILENNLANSNSTFPNISVLIKMDASLI